MPLRTESSQKNNTERLTLPNASVDFSLEFFHRPVSRHIHLVPVGLNSHLHIPTLMRVHVANFFEVFKESVCIKAPLQQGSLDMSHLRVVICACCKEKTSLKQEGAGLRTWKSRRDASCSIAGMMASSALSSAVLLFSFWRMTARENALIGAFSSEGICFAAPASAAGALYFSAARLSFSMLASTSLFSSESCAPSGWHKTRAQELLNLLVLCSFHDVIRNSVAADCL